MDQLLLQKGARNRESRLHLSSFRCCLIAGCWCVRRRCAIGCAAAPPQDRAGRRDKLRFAVIPKALDIPVFNYAKIGAERAAAGARRRRGPLERAGVGRSAEAEGDPRVVHHAARRRHRDLVAQRRVPRPTRSTARSTPAFPSSPGTPMRRTSKRIAFYGVDDLASGRIMGEQAIKLLNGKGKVALITSLGATNLQKPARRREGSAGEGAGHRDRRDLRHQGRRDPLRRDHRHRHRAAIPTSAAWISVGGWPVFTRNALAGVDPSKTKVISFDTISRRSTCCAKARCRCCSGRSTSAGAASR